MKYSIVNMKNILLTGGSSYLGNNLIQRLKNLNFFAIENRTQIENYSNLKILNIKDLNSRHFTASLKIDTVAHLASKYSGSSKSIENENYVLEKELLNFSLDLNVKNFIFAGSYFQDIFQENPTPYTIYKNKIEEMMNEFSMISDTKFISFHLGDIYGPADFRKKLIPYLLENENSNQIDFNSDGYGAFSPIYIDDVIKSIYQITKSNNKKFSIEYLYSEVMYLKEFLKNYKLIRNKNFQSVFNSKNQSISFLSPRKNLPTFETSLEIGLLSL